MHIHIHSLIHYARHARLLGSSFRFFSMMLIMLLISLLQLANAKPASNTLAAEEIHRYTIGISCHDGAANIRCKSGVAFDPVSPDVLSGNTYTGVYHRLKPGIVMVPRMNRTPKPKSVYRCFTRAPGMDIVAKCDA